MTFTRSTTVYSAGNAAESGHGHFEPKEFGISINGKRLHYLKTEMSISLKWPLVIGMHYFQMKQVLFGDVDQKLGIGELKNNVVILEKSNILQTWY